MATQEIYVLNKRLKLLHTAEGFKTSIDSVLLASPCKAKAGEHILDMGCGVGGAGLCVLTRVQNVKLTGVEIQADHVDLAKKNAKANGFADQCDFIHHDITQYKSDISFDHVICNPPYLEAGKHLKSPSIEKAKAMGHEEAVLKEWIDIAYRRLRPNGSLTMIHRADHMDKIIQDMGERFGALEIIPLWPKAGVNAKRVIVRAIKDRRSPMTLHAGLVLHQENGDYTLQANKIFRDLTPLLID